MNKDLINELKCKLSFGEVSFVYKKNNGDLREAKGTLNPDIIEEYNATPAGNNNYESDNVTRYYDLNSEGWRSFTNNNLIEIL